MKRAQILTLTAVLVITTGIAAAPIRETLSPLIARSFQSWLRHAPTAQTMAMAEPEVTVQSRSAELDAAAVGVPPVLSYSVGSGFVRGERAKDNDNNDRRESRAWTDYGGRRFGAGANRSSGVSVRSDTYSALRAAGSMSMPGNRRSDSQINASAQGAVRNSGSVSSGSGGGGGGGKAGDDKGKEKNGDLFGEHKSGLGELNGKHLGVKNSPHGGGVGGANVAVNPEPSTLFLFGTGIAAVAGALRRRLR